MNLINPTIVEIKQEPGIMGMISQIDYCAGICYGREFAHVTIEKQSQFVKSLIERDHMRPLEFGSVYLKLTSLDKLPVTIFKGNWCHINRCIEDHKIVYYITTNYRYIVEEQLEFVLNDYWCEPTEKHTKRRTFKLVCSRAVADEYRTHVTLSTLMKSTRYCNYENLEVVKPLWYDSADSSLKDTYYTAMLNAETSYRIMMSYKAQRQQARGILPMDMATTLLLCGPVGIPNTGWERFFKMRISCAAAPEADFLAKKLKDLCKNVN